MGFMNFRNLLFAGAWTLLFGLVSSAEVCVAAEQLPIDAGSKVESTTAPANNVSKPLLKAFDAEGGKYQFTIDATAAPDLMEWADRELRPVVQVWYPKLVAMLPSDGFEASTNVTLRFRND